jgi:hypothetical protein
MLACESLLSVFLELGVHAIHQRLQCPEVVWILWACMPYRRISVCVPALSLLYQCLYAAALNFALLQTPMDRTLMYLPLLCPLWASIAASPSPPRYSGAELCALLSAGVYLSVLRCCDCRSLHFRVAEDSVALHRYLRLAS